MSLQTIKRTCWWCDQRLMASGHAEVQVHDGVVWVHKVCVESVKNYMLKITARPSGFFVEGIDWSEKEK